MAIAAYICNLGYFSKLCASCVPFDFKSKFIKRMMTCSYVKILSLIPEYSFRVIRHAVAVSLPSQ